MAAVDILNTVASQLEVVLPDIQEINAAENDQLYGRVKTTAKVEKISRYLLRWVIETGIGGNFAKVNANGGTLPTGTQLTQKYLLAGYFNSAIAFALTDEQMKISGPSQQAIVDIAARQMAKAMIAQNSYDDVTFAQSGTGILTNSSSAVTNSTNATMTFNASTDTLKVNLLFEGMCVDVWDTTGATIRVAGTGAPLIITAIDYDAYVVTFNQTITTMTQGDIIALRAMAVYGPATLTSFSSGYPGTQGGSPTGGIGGDSFRHGYPYACDTTSSNYFYGTQKSTVPQLNPVRVNANGDTLQWEQGLRLIAKVKQKRPQKEIWQRLEGIAHSTQKAAAFELGMSISQKLMTGPTFGESLDLVPSNQPNADKFNFAGIPCNESTRQDRGNISFVNFDKIGRAEAAETGPYSVGGKTMFEGRDGSGNVVTTLTWFFSSYFENVFLEAGCFAKVDSLAAPSASWDA